MDPVAQYSPVNSNYVQEISPVCLCKVFKQIPDFVSQTLAVLSKDPVKMVSPSALKFKDTISPLCPKQIFKKI